MVETLKKWQHDSAELEEDELESPDASILPVVQEVAIALCELVVDPPVRVVPNGEGGVVFEWRNKPYLWFVDVEKSDQERRYRHVHLSSEIPNH